MAEVTFAVPHPKWQHPAIADPFRIANAYCVAEAMSSIVEGHAPQLLGGGQRTYLHFGPVTYSATEQGRRREGDADAFFCNLYRDYRHRSTPPRRYV